MLGPNHLREICLHGITRQSKRNMPASNREYTWKPCKVCKLTRRLGVWLLSNPRKPLYDYVPPPPNDAHSLGFLIGDCGLFWTYPGTAITTAQCVFVYGSSLGPVLVAPPPVCTASCFYCWFEGIYGLLMLTVLLLLYPGFL